MAVADPPTEAIRLSPPEYGACQRVLATSDWALPHVHQVARNAARLFDALRQFHGLGRDEERLLVAAALLHDVGYPADPERHHKVSARMVRTLLGPPFADDEVALIALIARYHRGPCPKLRHRRYAALAPEHRALVTWLGGILRVADGLDRAHDGAVGGIAASGHDGRLVLRVAPAVPTEAAAGLLAEDVAGGMRKRDLLERALGRSVVIKAR
ncbi:MAG TPA: HD domain-containing protein [Chloroflexota bacterium]|nr:HD domain-containing protein [Chloroflexota bacterium]